MSVVAIAAPADVEPEGAEVVRVDVFEDELVVVTEADDDAAELEVGVAAIVGIDVGGLAQQMLAMGRAAYQAVKLFTAVAAADADALAKAFASGVEHIVDEGDEVAFLLEVSTVPDAEVDGYCAAY